MEQRTKICGLIFHHWQISQPDLTRDIHLSGFRSVAAEYPSPFGAALLLETLQQKNWFWNCEEWLPCGSGHATAVREVEGRKLQAMFTACHKHSHGGMFSTPAVGQHSCVSQVKNFRPTTSSGANSRVHFLPAWKGFELILSNQQHVATPLDGGWGSHIHLCATQNNLKDEVLSRKTQSLFRGFFLTPELKFSVHTVYTQELFCHLSGPLS